MALERPLVGVSATSSKIVLDALLGGDRALDAYASVSITSAAFCRCAIASPPALVAMQGPESELPRLAVRRSAVFLPPVLDIRHHCLIY